MDVRKLPGELREMIITFIHLRQDLSSLRTTSKAFYWWFEEHRESLRQSFSYNNLSTIPALRSSLRERHTCDDHDFDNAYTLFVHLTENEDIRGGGLPEKQLTSVAETLMEYAGKTCLTKYITRYLVAQKEPFCRAHLIWTRVILSVTMRAYVLEGSAAQELVSLPMSAWLSHAEPHEETDGSLETRYTHQESDAAVHALWTYVGAEGFTTYLRAHLETNTRGSCDMYRAYLLGEVLRESRSNDQDQGTEIVRLAKHVLKS